MLQIFLASLLLSGIHASIPNHWLPIIAIGKTEKWSHRETMWATAISGFAHTLSTVLIGIVVGFFGYKLSSSYGVISGIIAPAILIILGIIYLVLDLTGRHHHHQHFPLPAGHHEHSHENNHHVHEHNHDHSHEHEHTHTHAHPEKQRAKWAVLFSLSLGMFLSPCAEIEAYYFQASTIGWVGIWIVSAVYTILTVGGMLLLVSLGMRGVKHLKSHYMEQHEKRITGIVLILVGLATYFVKF